MIFLIILLDQFLKIYIKTHFELGTKLYIFSFFYIFFVENPGIAYGIYLGNGIFWKVFLSIFRFFLFILISIFHYMNLTKKYNRRLIIPTSLILSGSLGNLLDCILYGKLFDKGTIYNKNYQEWIPYTGISKINFKGYASYLEGCVVDIFYFPIKNFHFPKWIPFFEGLNFNFFSPIFNLSDISIFIGVISILLKIYKFEKKLKI